MFNNVAFDVVIGMIFVYLLYSLLATLLQEIVAHLLNLRPRMLNRAIRRMLEDDAAVSDSGGTKYKLLGWFAATKTNFDRFLNPNQEKETLVRLFYQQPAIKYLGESSQNSKPSYLEPKNFASTLVEILRGSQYNGADNSESKLIKATLTSKKIHIAPTYQQRFARVSKKNLIEIPPETLTHLRILFSDARQDPMIFRKKLEDWFQETMDRASGWYKRQTQVILFLIGLLLAISFKVDTLAIYSVLAKDKEARQAVVQMAIQKNGELQKELNATRKNDDSVLLHAYKEVQGSVDNANTILGLGWDKSSKSASPIGILLTALALSMGAPFWFDLLNKFVQLRGAGPKPEKSDKSAGAKSGSGNMPTTTPDGVTIRG